MDNVLLLIACRRRVLWVSIAVALYGKNGFLDRIQPGV